MTSKERFRVACEHRRPDRPPIDYLAHPEVDRRLSAHLGLGGEDELLEALGCDFFYLPGRDISQNEGYLPYYIGRPLPMTETERVCPLGIRWARGAYGSKFAVDEALEGPFEKGASVKEILAHPWPKAADFDFSPLVDLCDAQSRRVLVGGLWTGILGDSYRMYGFQRFLTDMALRPDLVHALVDRMTEMYLELNDRLFTLLADRLDVWFFGNDFGHQSGLLFGEAMWADFFEDNLRKLVGLARGHGLRVMMHSCGAVGKLIPSLVDAGVEILDPVQVTAEGMEPAGLKEAFGDRIVFHGGIDTQQVLPEASPEEVQRHVTETIDLLGADGGYILAPSQIYQADIPVENILAVYRTAGGMGD